MEKNKDIGFLNEKLKEEPKESNKNNFKMKDGIAKWVELQGLQNAETYTFDLIN